MIRLILLVSMFFPLSLAAQDPSTVMSCGTKDGKVPWLVEYQKNPVAFPRSTDTLYIPVTIHLVGTSSGGGYFGLDDLLDAFCTLNRDFDDSAIQFYMEGDINYIPNNTYFNHNFDTGSEMMVIYNVPNTINCYISNSPGENLCGYSAYNLGVALAKSCVGPDDHTWAHELGHYLSLPHPFYGWEGYNHDYNTPAPEQINGNLVERVDGMNCDLAGDGFCDTPADYLNFRWNCNNQGLSNITQTDPLGEKLKSDGSLIMSYSSDVCSYRFSEEQIAAMKANALTDKAEFLYDQTKRNPVAYGPVVPVYPADGDTIDIFKQIPFVWEPMPEATHYMVEYTIDSNFNNAIFQFNTEGNSWLSANLIKNKTYYWRLRPYNRQHTCDAYSDIHSFTTGDQLFSSLEPAISGLTRMDVFPNPVVQGTSLNMVVASERAMDIQLEVITMDGRPVFTEGRFLAEGTSSFQLPLINAEAGIYFLRMRSESGALVRRIVVTN